MVATQTLDVSQYMTVEGAYASLRARGAKWPQIYSEFIDNAIDAGAKNINIVHNNTTKSFSIIDDGNGIEDLEKAFAPNFHQDSSTTQIGMHGIGFKAAFTAIGGKMRVESNHQGVSKVMVTDIEKLVKLPDQLKADYSQTCKAGTKITLKDFNRNLTRAQREALPKQLGYMFGPAISKQGINITVKINHQKYKIKPWSLPATAGPDTIAHDLIVLGKKVHLEMAILPPNTINEYEGVNVVYGPHMLGNTSIDLGGPYPNVCGVLTLYGKWKLNDLKTYLTDDKEKDALQSAILKVAKDFLKRAEKKAQVFSTASLTTKLSEELAKTLAMKGIKAPSHKTGPKRGNKKKITKGPIFPKNPTNNKRPNKGQAASLSFAPLGDNVVGRCKCTGQSVHVTLNTTNNKMNLLKEKPTKASQQQAIDHAIMIISDDIRANPHLYKALAPELIEEQLSVVEIYTALTSA